MSLTTENSLIGNQTDSSLAVHFPESLSSCSFKKHVDKQKGRGQVSPNDPVNIVGPDMAPCATQKCWEAPGNKALFIICSLKFL